MGTNVSMIECRFCTSHFVKNGFIVMYPKVFQLTAKIDRGEKVGCGRPREVF